MLTTAQSHSKLLSQPRDESIHEWLLYRAVVSFYGVTGVTNPKEEDVEINAFIAGIREQELVTGTRVSKVRDCIFLGSVLTYSSAYPNKRA